MSIPETLLWVLIFAVAAALLYGWGLAKSANRQRDLLSLLYRKGEKTIVKALRHGPMTHEELEKLLSGTEASLFYSRSRAVVKDAKTFTKELLEAMVKKEVLIQEKNAYRLAQKANRGKRAL